MCFSSVLFCSCGVAAASVTALHHAVIAWCGPGTVCCLLPALQGALADMCTSAALQSMPTTHTCAESLVCSWRALRAARDKY